MKTLPVTSANAVAVAAFETSIRELGEPRARLCFLALVAVPLSAASMPVGTIDVEGEALTDWEAA